MKAFVLACLVLIAPQAAPPPNVRTARPEPRGDGLEPAVVLTAERAWADADALLPLLQSPTEAVRASAIRALGRLEDVRVLPQLFAQLDAPSRNVRTASAAAIAQSLKAPSTSSGQIDPASDPELIGRVAERLRRAGSSPDLETAGAAAAALGRLALLTSEQVKSAETLLAKVVERTRNQRVYGGLYLSALRSLESLARRNPKLVQFDTETRDRLGDAVRGASLNDESEARRNALAALISARAIDSAVERMALKDTDEQVRRLAMTVLAGTGAGVDEEARADLIAEGLDDRSPLVRYDALRAYIRRVVPSRGCAPILDALNDDASHVVLLALDALGDTCKDDEAVTTRLVAEARTPPVIGSWHRSAHAFVALAKRSAERATISMQAFSTHPVWQVRMYAARAADAIDDVTTIERLAADRNDNVAEAALVALRRLRKDDALAAVVACLKRRDYQLLRTAALILKEAPTDQKLVSPLLDALRRITTDVSETSRDTRVAVLEALAQHGRAADSDGLRPFLKDFDPKVATAAATVIARWTGQSPSVEPARRTRDASQMNTALSQCVIVRLKSGRSFSMRMLPASAPVTVDHFLTLALQDRYYDGLTFHRVVPSFVIQGGSPGANEYAGQKAFMRDEIAAPNVRGSVGVSTRGRNTGDAQFFVNLVDNPRLDGDYTIFAQVFGSDMSVVDGIEEGDEIGTIRQTRCGGP